MEQILSIPPEIKEAVACHMALRRLGFPSEDIFFLISPEEDKFRIGMEVRYKGETFLIDIAPSELSDDELTKTWKELSEAINDYEISDEALQEIWENSGICKHHKEFVLSLAKKGMTPWVEDVKEDDLLN